ncbi:MAG TPA: T9SS type A sorting domain-containing protein [Saprospiraceae bacterium]|nr:T9SS type A sorting domain-containing protein [Saprospiraceae bacterium]
MKSILLYFFLFFFTSIYSQTTFNILPELGGFDGNSMTYQIIPAKDRFYTLGDIADSAYQARHVLAEYDYNGVLLNKRLIEFKTQNRRNLISQKYYQKNDSIIYSVYYEEELKGKMYLQTYLFELNLYQAKEGRRHRVNTDTIPEEGHGILTIFYDNSMQKFIMGSNINNTNMDIITIDSSLTRETRLRISTKDTSIFPYFVETYPKKNELIVDVRLKYYSTAYLKLNERGKIEKINQLKLNGNYGFYGYSILNKLFLLGDGDWIILVDFIEDQDTCINCEINYPCVLRVSHEFETIRWLLPLWEGRLSTEDAVFTAKLINRRNTKQYIGAGEVRSPDKYREYGFVFCVTAEGDSLWYRKYRPLNFEDEDIAWLELNDIVETDEKALLFVGVVVEEIDSRRRSWIVKLDSLGCFIPGCEKTVSIADISSGRAKAFEIYPNPVVNDRIYLLSRITTEDKARISLIDLQGRKLKSFEQRLEEGLQYIIDLPQDIPVGEYIFRVESKGYLLNEKLVVN